jgi:hypothetical protein
MALSLSRRSFAQLLVAVTAASSAARAASLPRPSGSPIITISGKITNVNQSGQAVLDRGMLEALGTSTIITKTPWYKERVRFEGVRLSALMRYVGAFGERVVALALNDYSSELPISDFAEFGTLLALKRDGEYMPVSDKGPLFIVYPYDSNPDLQQDRFYMRSVWQVCEMEVK